MKSVARNAVHLQELLTTQADEIARDVGLIQRKRKVTGAKLVQTLALGWLANPRASLSDLCCAAATVGLEISPQGLYQRLNQNTAEFLRRMLMAAVNLALATDAVRLPVLGRFTAVVIMDSSVITLPETLQQAWPGCRGAALKVSLRWELLTGRLLDLALRPGREHDRSSPLQTQSIPAGALRLADLGYYTLKVLRMIDQQGGYFLTRLPSPTVIFDDQDTRWKLVDFLASQDQQRVDQPIHLGASKALRCRVLAERVPPDVARARRRRLHAEAKRRIQPVSRDALELAGWMIAATNAPASLLSVQEAHVLLRVRWQIELLFKLWKSECRVCHWRSTKSWPVLCELYAKLLAVVLNHWLLLMSVWDQPERSLTKATRAIRQHAMALAHALRSKSRTRLDETLRIAFASLIHSSTIQRRRSRPSTYQRLAALSSPP